MSEHDLIMNHSVDILPAGDTLTRMLGDNEQLAMSRAMHAMDVKKRITSLDLGTMNFRETGTVTIEMMVGGELTPVNFQIRAISDELMRKLAEPLSRYNSKWPTKWDPESKTRVHDDQHPDYEDMAHEFFELNRTYEFKKLLHGLNMVLEYNGRVLWNPDDEREQDFDGAVARLDAIGIRSSDIKILVKAIDKLSNKLIKEDEEEYVKK